MDIVVVTVLLSTKKRKLKNALSYFLRSKLPSTIFSNTAAFRFGYYD